MKIIKKVNDFKIIYQEKQLGYWLSLFGSLLMEFISLLNTLISYSIITLFYAIFAFSIFFIKMVIRFLEKKDKEKLVLLFSSISMFILSIPLVMSMILTILFKEKTVYLFFWMIYAYATYGTIKMTTTIIGLKRSYKMNNPFIKANSYFSFIGALYTIQMMQFALISNFGEDEDLHVLQMMTQGIIFLICIYLGFNLFLSYIKKRKNSASV